MKQIFKLGAVAVMGAWLGLAQAAPDEHGTESHPVDNKVIRVKVEGPVDLQLRQGPVAALVISGDKALLSRVSTNQQGDLLTIGTDKKGFKFNRKKHGLRAELTLPALRELASDSFGATDVAGFSGDQIDLTLDGAGSMKVHANYRVVNAVLGGVGSMQVQCGDVEGMDVNLRGAGVMTVRGSGKWLKGSLGGLGNLDAQHFATDNVDLELSGLGNATVNAREHATLNLSGLGSVTVFGKPARRSVSVNGLGKVSWR